MKESLSSQVLNKHEWLKAVMKSKASDAAKLRAVALWKFSNEKGFSWPNQLQIEETVGHSSIGRTSQFVKELVNVGFVSVDYKQGTGKFRSANYQLTLPTNVGTNNPTNKSTNHLSSLKTTDVIKGTGLLVPSTEGEFSFLVPPFEGGALVDGLLAHTVGGLQTDLSMEDFIVDGRDTRDPPRW